MAAVTTFLPMKSSDITQMSLLDKAYKSMHDPCRSKWAHSWQKLL